jgi:hypothetical protein
MANEFKVKNGLIVSGSADFEQDLRVRGTLTVDELHTSVTTSSVIFESGSTAFGNSFDDTHTLTGSVNITGSITLNGQAIGTGKLDETTFESFTSSYISHSGSFDSRIDNLESFSASLDTSFVNEVEFGAFSSSVNTFTSSINTTIKSKLDNDGVISGSSQILNSSNIVSSSVQVTAYGFATTGSNLFIGTQTLSGSILPSVDNAYDLGSSTYQWRDVYISSGSLYVDGTKVLSSTAQELQITTDNGQSIKILEGTTDSIILQTADGNIELKSSADGDILLDPTNGKIMLKGPVEILNGSKIQSSVGGTPVVFANDIVVSGSIDLTGTIEGINLTDFSSSVSSKLDSIQTSTSSLNTFTSSAGSRLNSIETFTSSINTTINNVVNNGALVSGSSQINITDTTGYSTFSGSIATTDLNQNNRLDSLETASGSIRNDFNSYTGSNDSTNTTQNSRLDLIETSTGSLNSFTNSIDTTIKNKLNNDSVISGSIQVDLTNTTNYSTFSSSIATTDLAQDNRLNSLEGKTGSYATTGSNSFNGSQTITGSLTITQNLTVLGSSSLLIVTSSQLALSSSTISVNIFEPAERFGGLKVYDSGSESHLATASLLWDSQNNHWIYQNVSGSNYSGGMLLSGPRNTGSLGQEVGLTSGKIAKSVGGDHLDNSIMNETSGVIYITGSLSATGTIGGTNITAIESTTSSLNTYTSSNTANIDAIHTATSSLNSHTSSTNSRLISIETSTGSLNSFTNSINTTIKNKLNSDGVLSSSVQVVAALPSGTVSGSSQVLNGSGVWSGSAQLPSGVVSGSSQVLNGSGVWSGSAQLPSGVVSGSSQISFNGITDKPTLVSGSSQITYSGISSIPSGIVSGSVQIDLTATTNYSTGIKTRLNAEAVISGSAQVVAALPSGTVSGSAQITLSSTSGFGSYLNQAVLTTSSPSFVSTTFTGAWSNAGGDYTGISNPSYKVSPSSGYWRIVHLSPDSTNSGVYNYETGKKVFWGEPTDTGEYQFRGRTLKWVNSSGTEYVVLHAGNYTSYAMAGAGYSANQNLNTTSTPTFAGVKGSSYFDAQANSGFRIRNSGDSANTGGFTRRGLWEGNANYDPGIWAETGYGVYVYTNGSATARITVDTSGNTNINGYLGVGQSPNTSYRIITAGDIYLNGNANGWAEGTWKQRRGGSTYYDVLDTNSYSSYALPLGGGTVSGEIITSYTNGINTVNGGSGYAIYRAYGNSNGVEVQLGAHQTSGYGTVGTYSASNFGIKTSNTLRAYWDTSGHLLPNSNGVYNLGSTSLRWNTVFTSDLSMSNGIGDYTIVEGEEDLFIYNNKNNKVYKFLLQEVDSSIVPPKKI